jgi:hypothetical protein
MAQPEVFERELAVAAAEEREDAQQVKQRGDHGTGLSPDQSREINSLRAARALARDRPELSRQIGGTGAEATRSPDPISFLYPTLEDVSTWQPASTLEAKRFLLKLRQLPAAIKPKTWLFPLVDARRPMTAADIGRRWRKVIQSAALPYRNPEQLRHTCMRCASWSRPASRHARSSA